MTRIHTLSDLHYEIYAHDFVDRLPHPDADCLVIAGDYHRTKNVVYHLRSKHHFPDIPIIFVAGNHEHYRTGKTPSEDILQLRTDAENDRMNNRRETWFLENETIELVLGGSRVRFIGATLWTDFRLFGNPDGHSRHAQSAMNDYVYIKSDLPKVFQLRASETIAWHRESRIFIEAELCKKFDGKTVVLTHHAPSIRSVHKRFLSDTLTTAFASDCDDLLGLDANLWIHGHMHNSSDYMAGITRVVCNPRGYCIGVGTVSENRHFDAGLVIEI